MEDYPRRSMLGGLAASVALAAGCLSGPETERDPEGESEPDPESNPDGDSETDEGDEPDESDDRGDDEILGEPLFEFVPASVAADMMIVGAAVPEPLAKADGTYVPLSVGTHFDIDRESIDTMVYVRSGERLSSEVFVASGEFDLEGEPVRTEHDGVEYDSYETDSSIAAVYDDRLIVSDSREVITAAIDARRGETDRLIETSPEVEAGLQSIGHDHAAGVLVGYAESAADDLGVDAEEIAYTTWGMTVPNEDELEVTFGLTLVDADAASKDVAEAFEEEITENRGPFLEEPTTTVDGASITISFVEDLEAKREIQEYDSPGGLQVREVDPDAEYVEIELRRGEPTPVGDLTLELEGEVYDPEIWTGDAETIEAGDVIRIRMEDVEPGLEVTLKHEMSGREHESSTRILSRLEFEYDRDPESGTVTVTYRDEFRLSGDEITIALFDMGAVSSRREPEPERTIQPWAGESVEAGDRAEIDDVERGTWILVTRGGETFRDAISHHQIRPPGSVSFEHDREADRLSVTIEFQHHESRPADEYEIRVDDEPADTQWGDGGGRIESGATVHLEEPEIGQRVTVVWTDGDHEIGSMRIEPAIEVEFHRRDELVLEHTGGRSLPVENLQLHVTGDDIRTQVSLEEVAEGKFEEGDTIEVDIGADLEDVEALYLVYDGILIARDTGED